MRLALTIQLLLIVPCVAAVAAPTAAGIDLRAAQTSPATGMVQMRLQSTGETYYVDTHEDVIFAEEIVAAEAKSGPFGPIVSVSLKQSGGKKLYTITTRLLGKQLAVIVGGELVFVGTVQEPLTDQISLSGLKTLEAAKSVASQIGRDVSPPSALAARTVYVATATSGNRPDSQKTEYVVIQTKADNAQLSAARSIFQQVMHENHFNAISPSKLNSADLRNRYWVNLNLKDTQYDRMTIEVQIFRLVSPTANKTDNGSPEAALQWTGTFGLVSSFFLQNERYIMQRIVKSYQSPDLAQQENW